jgi:hypothetical protein
VCEEAAAWGVLLGFVDCDGVGVCSWVASVSNGATVFLDDVVRHAPPTSTPMRIHLPLAAGEVMVYSDGS